MARIIDALEQFFHPVTGKPLVNGKLKFLESGTNNTDKDTFKDASLTPGLENTNPVILDGGGNLAFSVFGTGIYNVIMFDENDVQLKQFDPVGATDGGSQFSEWLATSVYDKADIVRVGLDYYQSEINGNSNNNPTTSPAEWDLITIVKSYIANASGTVDAITADFTPNIHSLVNNTRVLVRASGANATTTPTFAPNGLAAKTIVKIGNQALAIGDISAAGHELDMVYNSSNDNWELLNPAGVISYTFTSAAQTITSAGLVVVAHGLPSEPKLIQIHLVCTAANGGYSIGDKIIPSMVNSSNTASTRFNGIFFDSSNISIRFSNNSSVFLSGIKTSGVAFSLNNANWDLFIQAYS